MYSALEITWDSRKISFRDIVLNIFIIFDAFPMLKTKTNNTYHIQHSKIYSEFVNISSRDFCFRHFIIDTLPACQISQSLRIKLTTRFVFSIQKTTEISHNIVVDLFLRFSIITDRFVMLMYKTDNSFVCKDLLESLKVSFPFLSLTLWLWLSQRFIHSLIHSIQDLILYFLLFSTHSQD